MSWTPGLAPTNSDFLPVSCRRWRTWTRSAIAAPSTDVTPERSKSTCAEVCDTSSLFASDHIATASPNSSRPTTRTTVTAGETLGSSTAMVKPGVVEIMGTNVAPRRLGDIDVTQVPSQRDFSGDRGEGDAKSSHTGRE